VTDCPCCAHLATAAEDHGCALAAGDDDLVIVSRTVVRLAAIVVDLRHGLTSTPHAVADYRREATEGRVIALADPVGVARRMTP
jgi:hypothetical protein